MYCFQCGKEIKDTNQICTHCDALQSQTPSLHTPEPSSDTARKNEVVRLVRCAMGGDDSVWGEIYEKTHRYVYFLALKFLRSEQDAQDITQESYIQAIRSIGQLYSADSFFGWLRTIVYSKCKDFVKKKKPVLLEDEAQDWLENMPEIDDKFLPDMTLDSAESRRMILELIDALPYQQRQTVLFYYYDEMTIDQIAALMECPAGTVKSRLNYARQQIKNGVEEHERKGIKLYGVATLPILTMLLRDQANALPIPPALDGGMGPIIQNTGSPSGASAPGLDIENAVGNVSTTAGKSTAPLHTKIIVCVVAALLVIGGGLFLWLGDGTPVEDTLMANPTPTIVEEAEPTPEEPAISENWQGFGAPRVYPANVGIASPAVYPDTGLRLSITAEITVYFGARGTNAPLVHPASSPREEHIIPAFDSNTLLIPFSIRMINGYHHPSEPLDMSIRIERLGGHSIYITNDSGAWSSVAGYPDIHSASVSGAGVGYELSYWGFLAIEIDEDAVAADVPSTSIRVYFESPDAEALFIMADLAIVDMYGALTLEVDFPLSE